MNSLVACSGRGSIRKEQKKIKGGIKRRRGEKERGEGRKEGGRGEGIEGS